MATVPSFEKILLEAHQSFGLNAMQSKDKDGFKNFEKSFKKHTDISKELLDDIFTALELNEEAKAHFSLNLMNWAGFHKELELHLWTFDAEPRQIVWYMLAYSYIPGLARLAAHWKIDPRANADIQGSMNWYFPQPRMIKGEKKLISSVSQVIEWLLDLLHNPMDKIKEDLFCKKLDPESIERTLYNWSHLQNYIFSVNLPSSEGKKQCGLPFPAIIEASKQPLSPRYEFYRTRPDCTTLEFAAN